MFTKILIANRGEIAVRIIHACRELGVRSATVYSEADVNTLHVQLADEAYCIGPPPALESYLDMAKIIACAQECGAEAIHPGYGFLAENHKFAGKVAKAGLVFIGPPAKALKLVGFKLDARKAVSQAGVAVIPGMSGTAEDAKAFAKEADAIGYPVLIKASAGGGGKGMRVAAGQKELAKALEGAAREAESAFGDATMYLEKFLEKPRHVEFQMLADSHGNVVHLFERECSIQRRHQKIVEETPSPALDDGLRAEMGDAALKVVAASGYQNAGTVEFLLTPEGDFYFLEVNARIQVEHPITEAVVGVDLVAEQIKIAAGEQLSLKQEELSQRGWAIECRIYAEDAEQGFLPASGKILFMEEPKGPGIRVDSGITSGDEVSVYYDPILSKVISWGPDRESARKRMVSALASYPILGIKTTVGFLHHLMLHPAFIKGETHTGFIDQHMADWRSDKDSELLGLASAVAAVAETRGLDGRTAGDDSPQKRVFDPWLDVGRWEIGK